MRSSPWIQQLREKYNLLGYSYLNESSIFLNSYNKEEFLKNNKDFIPSNVTVKSITWSRVLKFPKRSD